MVITKNIVIASLLLRIKIRRGLPGDLRTHLAPLLSGGWINYTYVLPDRCLSGSFSKICGNGNSIVFVARQSILVPLLYQKCIFFQLSYLNVPYCSSRSFCRWGEEILLFVAATSICLFKELLLSFQLLCKLNTIHSSLNIYPRIISKSRICSVWNITALTERLIWSSLITALNYTCLFQQIAGMSLIIAIPEWEEQKLCRISRDFYLLGCGCDCRIL